MQVEPVDLYSSAAWRFLFVSSLGFVVFGIATAWLGQLPPASLWGAWIGEHFFGGPMPEQAATIYDFMRGPLGGTIAGAYVLQLGLVAVPMRRGERWAAWTVVASISTWFVVDSAVSVAHGAWFNVWRINGFALLVTLGGVLGWLRAVSIAQRSAQT